MNVIAKSQLIWFVAGLPCPETLDLTAISTMGLRVSAGDTQPTPDHRGTGALEINYILLDYAR